MRTRYSAERKAKLVLETLRGEKTVQQIASENNIAPNLLTRWKSEAVNNLPQLFESGNSKLRKQAKEHEVQVEELYTQIGKLTTEVAWLKKNLGSEFTTRERLGMLNKDDELSVRRQAALLGISRSTFYYKAVPQDTMDLYVKRLIDEAHTKRPALGSRRITLWLKQQHSLCINRKAVQRHMREMGIEAVYSRPNTSKQNPEHKIYPYLLKNLDITHPNQVWSIDITYIPIQRSYLYLVAIIVNSLEKRY